MIKVQAKDQGGNTSRYTECATNIDIVKPFTPIASLDRNTDGTYVVADMENVKEIVFNNCCYFDYGWYHNCDSNVSELSMETDNNQECTFSYKPKLESKDSHFTYNYDYGDKDEEDVYKFDKISKKISGVSGTYKVYEVCYKNNLVLAREEYLSDDFDYVMKCNSKFWDKRTIVISDKAGNVSSMLTVNVNKE